MKVLNRMARYLSNVDYYNDAFNHEIDTGLKLPITIAEYWKQYKDHYLYHANKLMEFINEEKKDNSKIC